MAVVLRTARLRLRPARMSDLHDLHRMMSDPDVMRHWSSLPHRDLDETRRYLEPMVAAADQGLEFILEMEGQAVGKAGVWRLPEVGFLLRRDLWGRGLMAEALLAVIPHVFSATDTPSLTADVDPLNGASLRLLGRLGFEETGRAERTFCLGGVWTDSVYLALPRPAPGRPWPPAGSVLSAPATGRGGTSPRG